MITLEQKPPANQNRVIELYVRQISRLKFLSAKQELALAIKARQRNKQARAQLLKSSLPLVVEVARSYRQTGLSLLDLVAEGNTGLIEAIDQFDPRKAEGVTFQAFAAGWVHRAIKRAFAAELPISAAA